MLFIPQGTWQLGITAFQDEQILGYSSTAPNQAQTAVFLRNLAYDTILIQQLKFLSKPLRFWLKISQPSVISQAKANFLNTSDSHRIYLFYNSESRMAVFQVQGGCSSSIPSWADPCSPPLPYFIWCGCPKHQLEAILHINRIQTRSAVRAEQRNASGYALSFPCRPNKGQVLSLWKIKWRNAKRKWKF